MPQAFHSGCAARARATAARTSVGPALSSSPRTSPVAGFTEAMRDTANSTLVAICEEVYAGRNGRARALTSLEIVILSEAKDLLSAHEAAVSFASLSSG